MRPGYLFSSAASGLVRTLGLTTTSMATLAVGLWLMGLCLTTLSAGRAAVRAWTAQGHISVGLAEGAGPDDWPRTAAAALALEGVAEVTVITPAQSLAELAASGPRGAELAQGLEASLLPASLRVRPKGSLLEGATLGPLAAALAEVPGVADVEYGERPIATLRAVLRSAALWSCGLTAALGAALVFMVMSTIRLVLHSRRDEVEILQIIGATPRFVAAPFLLEGLLAGLAAGLLAGAATWGCQRLLSEPVAMLSHTLRLPAPLQLFTWGLCGAEMLAGSVLGVLGSFLAVNNFVRNEVAGEG